MKLSSHPTRIALVTGVYVLLTLAYTWPLAARLADGVAHDAGDPILNAWILWWTTKAVPLTAAWWNAPIFYPATGTLAFSEHLLGQAAIAAPLIALTGNPLLGYNVTLLATYVLSGLGAYFLGFTLTRRHDAAFLAGIAYAFAPYRLAQVPHIQMLSGYWTPVCLAALHRYGREPASRWIALAAIAWWMQALSCGYYMFFLSVLLALWMLWFAAGRWTVAMLGRASLAFAAALLLLAPVLAGYQSILRGTYGFSRAADEIRLFSADAAGLLLASEDLLVWGWVHVIQRAESSLFPGLTIVVLAALAVYRAHPLVGEPGESKRMRVLRAGLTALTVLLLVVAALPVAYGNARVTIGGLRLISIGGADRPFFFAVVSGAALMASLPRVRAAVARRSPLAFYLAAAVMMWSMALGPEPAIVGRPMLHAAPYGWLMHFPGFDGLRVPARFWMMALACLSAVAALAVQRLEGGARRVVVAAAVAGLLLDGWPRTFAVVAAPARRPSPAGVVSRLDLPMTDDNDAQALYQQTFDGVPLHNGFSGYFAPHYFALRALVQDADPRILQALAANGALGIVIDHAGDPDGALRRFVTAYPGAEVVRTERAWSSYRVPRDPAALPLPDREGTPLRVRSLSTFPSPPHAERALDGDLRTRWSGGVQQQTAEATVALEAPGRVGQLVIDLGGFVTDFPARLQIQVSSDGATWQTAWEGTTALHAYYGAIRHPREMPLVFALNRDNVGFIRLRQLGFAAHDWSVAELHVLR